MKFLEVTINKEATTISEAFNVSTERVNELFGEVAPIVSSSPTLLEVFLKLNDTEIAQTEGELLFIYFMLGAWTKQISDLKGKEERHGEKN